MNNDLVRLKSSVVVEPLVDRWHAWSFLISPLTCGFYAIRKHIPLLESFVSAPDIHAAACKNPALRGGPFVDLPESAVAQLRDLIPQTKEGQAEQIAFAESVISLCKSLLSEAQGTSIEPIYDKLPKEVRGYVELVYSILGHPDVRVNESLLYRSALYNQGLQRAMIYISQGDDRSFAFSTPRLPRADAYELNKPFSDAAYDFLSELRVFPKERGRVYEMLGALENDRKLVDSFLESVDDSMRFSPPNPTGKTRWKYFGHACVLVEAPSGRSVLVDPLLSNHSSEDPPRFSIEDLPEHVDLVVLTHNHADHVVLETLLSMRHRIGQIVVPKSGGSLVDPSLKLMLNAIGFKDVVEIDYLTSVTVSDLTVTALPFLGEHGDLDIRSKAAWLVSSGESKILFAADSNNLDPRMYDLIKQAYGQIDILFLGMECLGAPVSWTYGPLLPMPLDRQSDQSRRLNGSDCERGMRVITSLGCKEVYVYAMGAEPWLQFITSIDPAETTLPAVNARKLLEKCKEAGIAAKKLFGFDEGLA